MSNENKKNQNGLHADHAKQGSKSAHGSEQNKAGHASENNKHASQQEHGKQGKHAAKPESLNKEHEQADYKNKKS